MTLIDTSLQFPTVVFTIGLGIAVVFWLSVLLGALDIDLFDGGGADGADVGGGDGGDGGDGGGDSGLWYSLGLGAVPITISVSAVMLIGWIGTLLVMELVVPSLSSAAWIPPVVLPVMLVVALVLAGLLVRPLAPFFAFKQGKSNSDYIGYTCTITTGSVDDGFGQATIEEGGTVLIIPVRCDRPGRFARGDRALIIDYDPDRQVYVVEPGTDMLPAAGATDA
jgi:hypothetical protein